MFTLKLVFGALTVIVGSIVILRWLRRRELVDPRLVQAKLSRDACTVELRLAVIAPVFADVDALEDRLAHLVAAYRPFALATGNSLVPRRITGAADDLRVLSALDRPALLNVRELAGLWHLPQASDDVVFVERTTASRRLPLKHTVAPGAEGTSCRIGVSAHQGQSVPVHLPTGLLGRHLLAVAKTRRGKSSLLLRMVHHLMQSADDHRSVVLVDPHRDLAVSTLGLVPRTRQADVVYLDVSNQRRPFGINLLDVGLGWNRDQATANALRIFRREFDGYWGPRMEDAFHFAVLALFEANEAMCAEDPPGSLQRHGSRHQPRDRDPETQPLFESVHASPGQRRESTHAQHGHSRLRPRLRTVHAG